MSLVEWITVIGMALSIGIVVAQKLKWMKVARVMAFAIEVLKADEVKNLIKELSKDDKKVEKATHKLAKHAEKQKAAVDG